MTFDGHDELSERRRNKLKLMRFDQDQQELVITEKPQETFEDVGGLEDVKKKSI